MKALEKDVFMVNLNGDVKFNVDGILERLVNKTIFNYPHLEPYQSLLHPKMHKSSFTYHMLEDLIKYGTEKDGWFDNKYTRVLGNTEKWNSCIDVIFWDEFLFLEYEGLIKYDSVEIIKIDDKGVNGFTTVYIPYTKKLREFNDKIGIYE